MSEMESESGALMRCVSLDVQVTLVDASVFIALELQIPALPILHDLHLASLMDSDAVRFGEVTHGSAQVFPSQLTEWAFD